MSELTLAAMAGATLVAAPEPALGEAPPSSEAQLLAARLVGSLGGADAWKAAETLCLVEETEQAGGGGVARLHYFRDLRTPRIRVDRPDGHVILSPKGAWRTGGGVTEVYTADRVQRFVDGWPSNIYALYRRLAVSDHRLELHSDNLGTLDIYESGRRISSITLGADGGPARWVRYDAAGAASEEWKYGPLRSFGPLRFPSWGIRADGTEQFSYAEAKLSPVRLADALFPPSPPQGDLPAASCEAEPK